MPRLPPRPCTYPRCTDYASSGGRCEAHRVKHGWKHTKNRHDRGYGSKWDKVRANILRRDGFLCQVCKIKEAKQVDHITPKSKGGTDQYINLQSICVQCHDIKTLSER